MYAEGKKIDLQFQYRQKKRTLGRPEDEVDAPTIHQLKWSSASPKMERLFERGVEEEAVANWLKLDFLLMMLILVTFDSS